jgi:hypothetical protein
MGLDNSTTEGVGTPSRAAGALPESTHWNRPLVDERRRAEDRGRSEARRLSVGFALMGYEDE